VSIQDKVSV